MEKNKNSLISGSKVWLFIISFFGLLLLFLFLFVFLPEPKDLDPQNGEILSPQDQEIKDIQKFNSAEDFEAYLIEAMEKTEYYYGFGEGFQETMLSRQMDIALPAPVEKTTPERYSETNVQVEGVDEPDILKTDGVNIYMSLEIPYYWIMPRLEQAPFLGEEATDFETSEFSAGHTLPRPRYEEKTKIIKAFPAEEMSLISEIEKAGKLLLKDDILIIFERDKIFGYFIGDKKNPEKKWEIKIDQKTSLAAARLYKDTVYLIFSSFIQPHRPCVIEPLFINDNSYKVECTDIFHPGKIVPVDTTYTVLAVDLKNGEKKHDISFIGSAKNSVIYVSLENIYISYYWQKPIYELFTGFFKEECRDIIPADVIKKLEKLEDYNISSRAKIVEFEVILEEWIFSLHPDEKLRIETEFTNRMPGYYKKHMRSLESTGFIKIGLSDLKIRASGSVPGFLLNQFSIDEYKGNLRIATTVGERNHFRFSLPRGAGIVTVNDIYVLNEDLNQIGSVKNLGLEERVYSARFIGDMGYVVTFREIDPFYVLDLSDPHNPEMKGELKIPGYSSYLHPINDKIILGIGKEEQNVKLSMFDVSNPYKPQEIEKYFLNEYWSEILNNHHAFLLDKKYEIFFIPGGKGAYIFSFSNNKLSLVRTVKENQVKRALYIDDYLYIITAEKIVVLDQNDWKTIKEFDF